jgi:nucleoside-diphosphate-sugar epimerase
LLDEIRSGTVSGGAEDRLNLIHRDDAVSAILHCFNAPDATPGDVFNVSDGAPATRGEIANWTAHRLGIPAPLFTGAPRGSRRPVPLQRTIISTKLQSALQWKPQFPTFREGYDALLRAEPATSP